MATRQANMHTERDLSMLRLLQLFDSQFPIGAFAHSGGLETYAQEGAGLEALRSLMRNQVDLGWGRGDLSAACLAFSAAACDDADSRLERIARDVSAFKVVPSVRHTSERLGRRMLRLLRRLYPVLTERLCVTPAHQAVVVGASGCLLGVPLRDLLLAYGHSLALGNLAAATRCMPVSPDQAQLLLVELQPQLSKAIDRALHEPEELLFTCTPALDVRCHQQTRLHTRLFQS